MTRVPAVATIRDAYVFTATHLGGIIGLIWVPMVLVTIEPISITGRILLQDPGDWAQDLRGYL